MFSSDIHAGSHRFSKIGQILNKLIYNILIKLKLSNLISGQYPVWMTQKPRKTEFGEIKSKNFSKGEHSLDPPLEACAFGARLGNRSVFILDPRLSSAVIWLDPPREGGKFRETPYGSKSLTVNSLFAIIESLSWKGRSKNLLLLTVSPNRIDIDPVYSWLTNVIVPPGEIPTRPFNVVWFL